MRRLVYWALTIALFPFYAGVMMAWSALDAIGRALDRWHDRVDRWSRR